MRDLLLQILGGVGIAWIVSAGRIAEPTKRKLVEWIAKKESKTPPEQPVIASWVAYLLNCQQCMGFWCGVLVGLIQSESWQDVICLGGAVSVCSMSLGYLFQFLGRK